MNWKRAILSSGIVALVVTVLHQLISTGGTGYVAQVDWEVVNGLPYQEAQQYLAERTGELSRLISLRNAVSYPHFWLYALMELLLFWALGLTTCWLYGKNASAS